jgi:folate-binding protein YgfZ
MTAVIIDRSKWGRLKITGGDRVRFLQGLTTINVEALGDGAHAWGAILNPKGRVLSVINLARVGDAFVATCEPSLAEKTHALLQKYAVMDDVTFEPLSGPAHQVWDGVATVWTAPILAGDHPHAVPESEVHVEQIRIHAGFLRYACDVDEDHFPFETPLVKFLDYEKGCYVGQEPVFRVHAQGNSARMLRGFVIEGAAPVPPDHHAIKHPAKESAGVLTSQVLGEAGTTLALGYLHRTTWDAGSIVEIDGRRATVHELPFG